MTVDQDFDFAAWAEHIIDGRTFHARDDLAQAWQHGSILAIAERCEDGVLASQALAAGGSDVTRPKYVALERVWSDLYFATLDLWDAE